MLDNANEQIAKMIASAGDLSDDEARESLLQQLREVAETLSGTTDENYN